MVTTAGIKELREATEAIGESSLYLGRDTSKLVSGWQKINKTVMLQIIQSLYHMGWNLKDLRENIGEITGTAVTVGASMFQDIQYEDQQTLTEPMLIGRTKNWYRDTKGLHSNIRRVLAILDAIEARPYRVGFIVSRIYLDLHFFKDQFEAATGEKLEN